MVVVGGSINRGGFLVVTKEVAAGKTNVTLDAKSNKHIIVVKS